MIYTMLQAQRLISYQKLCFNHLIKATIKHIHIPSKIIILLFIFHQTPIFPIKKKQPLSQNSIYHSKSMYVQLNTKICNQKSPFANQTPKCIIKVKHCSTNASISYFDNFPKNTKFTVFFTVFTAKESTFIHQTPKHPFLHNID